MSAGTECNNRQIILLTCTGGGGWVGETGSDCGQGGGDGGASSDTAASGSSSSTKRHGQAAGSAGQDNHLITGGFPPHGDHGSDDRGCSLYTINEGVLV